MTELIEAAERIFQLMDGYDRALLTEIRAFARMHGGTMPGRAFLEVLAREPMPPGVKGEVERILERLNQKAEESSQ